MDTQRFPNDTASPPQLTERFLAALALANEVHGKQRRLGTEIPYLTHLLVVTGLVLEDGGRDAGDRGAPSRRRRGRGGEPLLQRIRVQFGGEVAGIVAACSDSIDADDPRTWRERKAGYLAHLPEVTDEAILRVVLADKVHNARSIVRDYRAEGEAMWARFTNKTIDDQLCYYRALLAFFATRHAGPLVEDLRRAVAELEELKAAAAAK